MYTLAFIWHALFLRARSGAQIKLRARKIGRVELRAPLSIFAKHISVFLKKISQLFCRKPLSMFWERLLDLQSNVFSKHSFWTLNVTEHSMSNLFIEVQINYVFSLTVRTWKLGMGYCVINIHDIKPRVHFRGWFIWKNFVTLVIDIGGRGFVILVIKKCEGWRGVRNSWFSGDVVFEWPLNVWM